MMSDGQHGGSSRRDFLKMAGVAGATATALSAASGGPASAASGAGPVPAYLKDYADLYKQDPREAAFQWFREARFGLFLHFGVYSLLGRGEWVQFRDKIRVDNYSTLMQNFTANKFDVEAIADLAVEAEMNYINITTKHHDSFCLFDTDETTFKSTEAACGRDLVGELAEACRNRGLGLCLYYSHGRDWKHPHAPNRDEYGNTARPHYDPPELTYAKGDAHHLEIYNRYCFNHCDELLSNYGPIAAIWLDGVGTPRQGDVSAFRLQELYDRIHDAQPQVLVSYKDGLTGTEDFYAPEEGWGIEGELEKPGEVCASMHKRWGYVGGSPHMDVDEAWKLLSHTAGAGCNLLLNTGPMPDGSIHPKDAETLRKLGKRIRSRGYPKKKGL